MFGMNEVASVFQNDTGTLLVTDIFETLQGEGPQSGWPAVFVRLTRCNLRCWFCDTDFERGREYTAEALFSKIMEFRSRNKAEIVVITGGEPLLQNIIPLIELIDVFSDMGVSIETAGTVYVPGLEDHFDAGSRHKLICSPKTPIINRHIEPLVAAYKYIVQADQVDAEGFPNVSTQIKGQSIPIFRPTTETPIYYQPMDEYDDEKNYANVEAARDLAMKFGRRLSLQMHKLANLP